MNDFVSELRARRRVKYGAPDIREFAAMMKEGALNRLPLDLAPYLVKYRPQTDDELSLWIHVCLEQQGLTCNFTREANTLQTDLKDTCSHLQYLSDMFFDRAGDVIVLGNRGAGKTLTFAVSLLIESLFKDGYEMAHLGAIEDQARRCYRYFQRMTGHPLFQQFLDGKPTSTRTCFVNGSSVEILVGTMAGVNCIHGDMLVECSRDMTRYPDGVPIRELVDKEFVVPSLDEETGEITYRKAKGLYSGKSPCLKIELAKPKQGTQGKELEYTYLICTPDHPILMADSHKYRLAKNLTKGDRVQSGLGGGYIHRPNPKHGTRQRPECRANIQPAWKQKGKIVSQHRLIAATWFGEDAIKDKVIHHKDGNRLNNSVDNLEIMEGIQHHFHHFGEDSQAYITPDSIRKMANKMSIKGKLTYYWQDKDWLSNELQSKSVAQIAEEQDVHYETIRKWAVYYKLEYRASDEVFDSRTTRTHMEEVRKDAIRRQAEADLQAVAKEPPEPLPVIYRGNRSVPDCFNDAQWLENELKTKALTQIAFENDVPTVTVRNYASKFNLAYQYSSPEYREAKVRQHMKEVQARRKAEQEAMFVAMSPEAQELDMQRRAITARKKQLRKSSKENDPDTLIKYGAWTVVSISPYLDGDPQDVYDITVEVISTGGHNFHCQHLIISNSPHPVASQLDEVELMDWNIMQEAFNMARSAKGYRSSTRLTSTRKKASGTMQRLLDEAHQRGFKVYQWNLWDTIATCPLRTNDKGEIDDAHTVYSYTDKKGDPKSCYVYESCMDCTMLPACHGQAKTSNAGPNAVVAFDDAVKLYKTLDPDVWDAQVICVKPGRSNLVYPMFDKDIHVIDYEHMLKEKHGSGYDEIFDVELDTYAGQDAGFGCPATIFLQLMDDPETGEQTVVIFDELYEKNIAPSKYVEDFLIPRQDLYNVQEWFCDPSNSQQLMAEMDLQDLYTVPGLKNVDEGIDAVKALFSLGRLLIDKKCKNLIWELGRYEKQFNGKPKKVDDHLVDALRFGVNGVGLYNQVLDEVYK